MSRLDVRAYDESDRLAVIALWEACDLTRAWNDPDLDIDRKLARDADGLLVGETEGRVVASVMVGYDGHRGWINYLAVDPTQRGGGWGRKMMAAAEQRLGDLGCPKVNLQIRTTNLGAIQFYEAIGYSMDEVVSFGKRLVDDN